MRNAAIPASLRRINRRLILRHMMQVPVAARAELADVAGMSCVTAGKIVDELLAQGVLEPVIVKRDGPRPGRPGQGLRLNARSRRFVLVQMGVLHTRVSYAALGTENEAPWEVEFETPANVEAWTQAVREAVAKLKPPPNGGVWGVLMSVPGILDEEQGKVLFSPNVHWSEGVDFRAILRGIVDAPVELMQEIRVLALGQMGASPREGDFLLVDFGHGIGGAAVLNGELFRGTLPLTVELGHAPVLENTRPCGCGAVGCMETLMSRRGLFMSVRDQENLKITEKYAWSAVMQHIAAHGLEPWLMRSLRAAAGSIASAMNVLGVARVVITGTPSEMLPDVRAFLVQEVEKAALWGKFGKLTIEYAQRRRMHGMISVGIDRLLAAP